MKTITLTKIEFKQLLLSEALRIEIALNVSKGNRRNASKLLGICERTLYRKILMYGFPYKTNY